MIKSVGKLEVTGHGEAADRGSVVVGHMVEGSVRPGMYAWTRSKAAILRVASVEATGDDSGRQMTLSFDKPPSFRVLQVLFPIGTLLEFRDASAS